MMSTWRFVQPVDTLSLRGNKLFGAAGDFGESAFPPRPSVLAGAFRSLLLAQAGEQIEGFTQGRRLADVELDRILGTPREPGEFALQGVFPACKGADGRIRLLLPLPADLLVFDKGRVVRALEPQALSDGILASTPKGLPKVAVLRQPEAAKPESGWLLSQDGIAAYLAGQAVQPAHLVKQSDLWAREARVGIGLSRESRTAEDGKLFTVEHTVPRQPEHDGLAVGLAVNLAGTGARLPEAGFIRLGGDGRAAAIAAMPAPGLQAPLERIRQTRRFKLVLTTPGLFHSPRPQAGEGPGERESAWHPHLPSALNARLVCAAAPRYEVVSGWNLAAWSPKDAERAVPAGSVFWFEDFDGDPGKLAEWVAGGLWGENADSQRRAEGYNQAWLGTW